MLAAVLAIGTGVALVASRGGSDRSVVPASSDLPTTTVDDDSVTATEESVANAQVDTTGEPTSTMDPLAPLLPGIPGIPSSTAPAPSEGGRTGSSLTIEVQVLDGDGRPFASGAAGVSVCRNGIPQTVCPAAQYSVALDADGDGHLEITVQSDTRYVVGAFVTGTGWPGGWRNEHGTVYHFSDGVQLVASLRGKEVVASVTDDRKGTFPVFNIIRPQLVTVRVVQADGSPFPPGVGGVKACVVDRGSACRGSDPEWRVAHDKDGNGTVEVDLDPGVNYEVQGIANGTGWCNPWFSADGTEWHFGNTVSPVTAEQLRGTQFVVPDPCASSAAPTSTSLAATTTTAPATTSSVTTSPGTTEPATSSSTSALATTTS